MPDFKPDKYYRILNYALITVSSCVLAYTMFMIFQKKNVSFIALMYGTRNMGVFSMALSIACMTGSAALRIRLPFFAPALIPVILFAVNSIEFFRMGFGDGFSGLWVFVIPPLIYFTAGKKIGFSVSLAILAGMLIFLLFPRLSFYYYSNNKMPRIITVYLLLFFTAHIYEYVRDSKEKKLEKLNEVLKAERDEFKVMRDSFKTGLFLMDKDLIIQERYSRILKDTFGASKLSGKKFTDLLTSSLTSAEISTLTNFFEMVYHRRFDADMLEDINPLQELKYIHGEGGPEKILHCTFTPIDHVSGETLIMGNIEDITAKIAVEKQLKYEEAKHQEEINALFEVLQVDPDVFNDFIEDAEYEFETINNILKNSRISSKDTLTTIYQSMHAIKSNAIILGLNNYGRKLHEIETYIKELQGKPEVVFDDMLGLAVRIEGAMKDKNKFSESIEKLKLFAAGGGKKSAVDILIESANRTAERTAAASGKKINMDTSGVDGAAFEKAPRRLVKEVMLQLVRNAVFHGIESPEERSQKGKIETGNITFSLKLEGEKVHVLLKDDGQGLDFEKIRQRAEKMHLIKKNEKIENKNLIYQAIFRPGFSTAGTEGMYAGRGVGLDLVYSRIKEYNGTIKIQTEAGKGSIFHVFLPVQNTLEDIKNNE
jgi:two-component system chemotaxis sensor kinase CheA